MRRNQRMAGLLTGAAALLTFLGAGAAIASSDDDASDKSITGDALDQAKGAALAETGGGSVTETEVGDEDSLYEVEVTLVDGRQVDVQLDENFEVVSSERDGEKDDS
ncbi:hypothetical protein BH18ACT9_BH18ACT9_12510 [soil metagenome]